MNQFEPKKSNIKPESIEQKPEEPLEQPQEKNEDDWSKREALITVDDLIAGVAEEENTPTQNQKKTPQSETKLESDETILLTEEFSLEPLLSDCNELVLKLKKSSKDMPFLMFDKDTFSKNELTDVFDSLEDPSALGSAGFINLTLYEEGMMDIPPTVGAISIKGNKRDFIGVKSLKLKVIGENRDLFVLTEDEINDLVGISDEKTDTLKSFVTELFDQVKEQLKNSKK